MATADASDDDESDGPAGSLCRAIKVGLRRDLGLLQQLLGRLLLKVVT